MAAANLTVCHFDILTSLAGAKSQREIFENARQSYGDKEMILTVTGVMERKQVTGDRGLDDRV